MVVVLVLYQILKRSPIQQNHITLLPSSVNLSFAKYEHMAGGNSTQGYYVGGLTHGGSYPAIQHR